MKAMVRSIAGSDRLARAIEKESIANHLRLRGTPGKPLAPRDIQVQSASRGALVTWKLPTSHDDVAGWRVYQGNEFNLAAEIRDKGTRQLFIPLNSGANPPMNNIFVSSLSTLGRESQKILIQAQAIAEAGAPAVPTVPPGYTDENAGGGNKQLIRFKGESQYID